MTGTGALVRLALRRDRVKLPIWLLGITIFVPYFYNVLSIMSGQLAPGVGAEMLANPMIRVFAGPVFGAEDLTPQRMFLSYYIEFLLAASLMNILLIARHTRGEEQSGRAELVRATVIGRHAPLTAALVVAVLANAALALLIAVAMAGLGLPASSSLLSGSGVGATGLVFAGVTALTVQITEHTRGAGGLAAIALGVAWTFRAVGAAQEVEGGPFTWLSPLGWAQLTRILADERWWPLALSLLLAGATSAAGYALSARRDLGAGLLAQRSGRATAAPWLGSPVALAFRLQRAAILWWGAGLIVLGFVWGSLAGLMREGMAEAVFGTGPDIARAYLSLMVVFMGLIIGVFAILSVARIRTEEVRGRAAPLLAAPVGRWAWLGSYLLVAGLSVVAMLAVMGLATAAGAAVGTGDGALAGEVIASALARAPEILLLLALAAALFGLAPRWIGVAWAVLVFGGVARFAGPNMDWPGWLLNVSPFNHIPRMPLEPFAALPLVILTALAAALTVLGLYGWRRRDVAAG